MNSGIFRLFWAIAFVVLLLPFFVGTLPSCDTEKQ